MDICRFCASIVNNHPDSWWPDIVTPPKLICGLPLLTNLHAMKNVVLTRNFSSWSRTKCSGTFMFTFRSVPGVDIISKCLCHYEADHDISPLDVRKRLDVTPSFNFQILVCHATCRILWPEDKIRGCKYYGRRSGCHPLTIVVVLRHFR